MDNKKSKIMIFFISLFSMLIMTSAIIYAKKNPENNLFGGFRRERGPSNIITLNSVGQDVKPDGNNTRDLGAYDFAWNDLFVSGTAYISQLAITTSVTSTGNIIPGTNNTYNLGAYGNAWKNVFASGTLYASSAIVGSGGTGAPSFAFATNTNTGIYGTPANGVGITASGSQIVRADPGVFYLNAAMHPTSNNSKTLGVYSLAFSNIYASSTAYLNYVSSTAMDANSLNLSASSTLTLTSSTTDSNTGVIYKGSDRFIHNFSHPTGSTAIPNGQNTFIGLQAGNFTMGSGATSASHGSQNTGIGYQVLSALTTGFRNTAVGSNALQLSTTANQNTALGYFSLANNTSGNLNTAVGLQSLLTNTTGNSNIAIGINSLYANTTGYYNIGMGYEAGRFQADGTTALTAASSSIYIGSYSKGFNNSDINSIVIGDSAVGIGANTIVLGNNNILTTMLKGNVGVTTSTPRSLLHVSGASGATTSTIWAGDLWGVRGQVCLGDSDGVGASCMYLNNGVMYAYATSTY